MSEIFKIHQKSKISKARTGTVTLAHGEIQTPVFMSIGTIGSVKGLDYQDLEKLNAEIILGNTYHLWLRPGLKVLEKAGGLHKFINWDRPILTDSGGFQAFSLSKIRKFTDEGVFFKSQVDGQQRFLSPEISMGIQTILGSDIALVLDEALAAEVNFKEAKMAMYRTFAWAKRSKSEFERLQKEGVSVNQLIELEKTQSKVALEKLAQIKKAKSDHFKKLAGKEIEIETKELEISNSGDHLFETKLFSDNEKIENLKSEQNFMPPYPRYLFGIPQGAQFPELRQESARLTMELDFPGYSIGGVANGGEPEEIMYAQVLAQTEILEEEKPRHLLGVGTPRDIIEMVKRGIDMFDCVYPTRNARHGSIFVWTDYEKLEYEVLKIQSSRFEMDFSPINKISKFSELKSYKKAYLRHLFKAKELLALRLATLNNLEFYYDLMIQIRRKINEGGL